MILFLRLCLLQCKLLQASLMIGVQYGAHASFVRRHQFMTNNRQSPPTPRRAPSVAIAFRTLGRTLRHGYDNLGTLAMVSIMWYIGAFLILPIGAVTAAIHRVTQPMSEERAANWRSFLTYMRRDVGWGTALVALLVAMFLLLLTNIRFYALSPATALRIVALFFATLLIVGVGVALYVFPLALRQEDQRIGRTLRNALVMTLANLPGAFVSVVLLLILCSALLFIPPLFVLIPGVVALWGEENARLLLVASGYLPEDPFADRRKPK